MYLWHRPVSSNGNRFGLGYQAFYQTRLSDELSTHTWQRLTSAESAHIYGFAPLLEQQMVGFVHVIEHDSCWTFKLYAYLQDLFTHPDYRGQGVARLLIEQVYTEAKKTSVRPGLLADTRSQSNCTNIV